MERGSEPVNRVLGTYDELELVLGDEDGLPLRQSEFLVGLRPRHEVVVDVIVAPEREREERGRHQLLHSRSSDDARNLLLVLLEHPELLLYCQNLHLRIVVEMESESGPIRFRVWGLGFKV